LLAKYQSISQSFIKLRSLHRSLRPPNTGLLRPTALIKLLLVALFTYYIIFILITIILLPLPHLLDITDFIPPITSNFIQALLHFS
jgi:hypothetical protein